MAVSHQVASDPTKLGIDLSNLEALKTRVRKEVDDGFLPSAQFALAKDGQLIAFETYGDTPDAPLYSIFSATKAITSAAAWMLIETGNLDVSLPVIHYIPEFAEKDDSQNKDKITVEHLFTHMAGFPHAPFRPSLWVDKQATLARFSSWKLNWQPGSRFEYHPTSSMWVIGELIERLSGQSYQGFVRNKISIPLGLEEMWVGAPVAEHPRICDVTHVGTALTSEDYLAMGMPEPPPSEVNEAVLLSFNNEDTRQIPIPGGGGIMSAAELALFYQALLTGTNATGEQLWQPRTLTMAKTVLTGDTIDQLGGQTVNRALGICIAGDERRNLRGFGHTNSELTFGHSGAGGQIAWADPKTGLSFCYCTNGHDRNPVRAARRTISISNKAAVCA